jgi:hypothetical protein
VHADQKVDSLIKEEIMPGLSNVVRLVMDDHSQDDLRNDDGDASRGGNPSVGIGDTTCITLSVLSAETLPSLANQRRCIPRTDSPVVELK